MTENQATLFILALMVFGAIAGVYLGDPIAVHQ